MDIKEKRILVSLIGSVLVFLFYALYVYNKHIAGSPEIINDFQFWGKAFLFMIPVAIVAQIIIHIILAIFAKITTNEDLDTIDDERDKLIELKSIKISHYIFLAGFMTAMIWLAIGAQPGLMFILLFSSGFIASIIGEIAKLYYYRKGV
jgi:hypothetical protein